MQNTQTKTLKYTILDVEIYKKYIMLSDKCKGEVVGSYLKDVLSSCLFDMSVVTYHGISGGLAYTNGLRKCFCGFCLDSISLSNMSPERVVDQP